jgi:hypothetical protein
MIRGLPKSGAVLTAVAMAIVPAARPAGINIPVGTESRTYRLQLAPFVSPPAGTIGLIVKARINGGPPLRLLLDSGADSIVLDRRSAAKSACTGADDIDLVGAGTTGAAKAAHARTVEIADLTLRDVPLLIAGQPIPDGIQGVLPLAAFSGFLIRLDVPRKTLDLLPYPAQTDDWSGSLNATSSNRLLFLRGTANRSSEGYFLLDTGAAFSAISRTLARDLNLSEALARRVPLQAGAAGLDAPLLGAGIRLRFGETELDPGPVVAIDLSHSSRYHRLDIAGLIGYPAVAGSVLLVSYRDGLVRIGPK